VRYLKVVIQLGNLTDKYRVSITNEETAEALRRLTTSRRTNDLFFGGNGPESVWTTKAAKGTKDAKNLHDIVSIAAISCFSPVSCLS
jgi:hypothetical protein